MYIWKPSRQINKLLIFCFVLNYFKHSFGDIFSQPLFMSLSKLEIISKYEVPRMFAIASTTCILYRNWCIYGRTLSLLIYNKLNVYSSCVFFWEYLQLQHVVPPHQPKLQNHSDGGVSWTHSSVVEGATLNHRLAVFRW